jgi:hypothetical protein
MMASLMLGFEVRVTRIQKHEPLIKLTPKACRRVATASSSRIFGTDFRHTSFNFHADS